MAPDRGSCYAGRMSLVATLALLMQMQGRAADEVFCFVRGRLADEPANVLPRPDHDFGGNS
jgi:hypothetical protein